MFQPANWMKSFKVGTPNVPAMIGVINPQPSISHNSCSQSFEIKSKAREPKTCQKSSFGIEHLVEGKTWHGCKCI